MIKHLRFSIFLILIFLSNITSAQSWESLGVQGFSSGGASHTSLALDKQGIPYVAYAVASGTRKATVMKLSGSNWVVVGQPEFSDGRAEYISLVVANDGTPFIAFKDEARGSKVTVMKFNGTSWVHVGTPGFSAGTALYVSLAVDGSGVPYVAYSDYSQNFMATVMKFNGKSWVTVGSPGFSGSTVAHISLALDENGTPHISFSDYGYFMRATLMRFEENQWKYVGWRGFSGEGATYYTSLAVDQNGMPYVAYQDYGRGKRARVMKLDSNGWNLVGAGDASVGVAEYVSLALDGSGTPYIAYRDYTNGEKVTVRVFDGANWVNIGSPGFSSGHALYPSLKFNKAGLPYVAYADFGNSAKATLMRFPVAAKTITTAPLAGTNFCTGGKVSVAFNINGSFETGNIFTAQLSDETGSFNSPVVIGTGTTSPISATLPELLNVHPEFTYKIRVIASRPNALSTGVPINITCKKVLKVKMSGSHVSTVGGADGTAKVTISEGTAPYQVVWELNGQKLTATTTEIKNLVPGEYKVTVTDAVGRKHIRVFTVSPPQTLWAWGSNSNGELGYRGNTYKVTPTPIAPFTDWVSIVAHHGHSLGIRKDGTLWAWGMNDHGQLGVSGQTDVPLQVGVDKDWASVHTGGFHTVAIKKDGSLWAWGSNNYGQLGDGTTINRVVPVRVGTDNDWIMAAAGTVHTIAIKSDGSMWGWGANHFSVFGKGNAAESSTLVPVKANDDTDWYAVSVDSYHALALKTDGSLWGWGANFYGQLGNGTTTTQEYPVMIGTTAEWDAVSTGFNHTLAIKKDGTLWAWGDNSGGKLGDGTQIRKTVPIKIGDAKEWAGVSASSSHSLALKRDGSLWTWGGATPGDGSTNTRDIPTNIDGATDWRQVAAGSSYTLALQLNVLPLKVAVSGTHVSSINGSNGTVSLTISGGGNQNKISWERNGQSITGTSTALSGLSPGVYTATVTTAWGRKQIRRFTVSQPQSLWTWGMDGYDSAGKLMKSTSPRQLESAIDWVMVSQGGNHSLALKRDGSIWAWGDNDKGQLGIDGVTYVKGPVRIGTSTDWIQVAAGQGFSVGLKTDGTLWAWGNNEQGQLGDGSKVNRKAPVRIGRDTDWVTIASGNNHSLALKSDGSMWGWGYNSNGEIGDNTVDDKLVPVPVGSDKDWMMVSVGGSHSVALKVNGSLWAWGSNGSGQLGNGTTNTKSPNNWTPRKVSSTNDWAFVAAGQSHTIAIKKDGSLWAWGGDIHDRNGDGTTNIKTTPVQVESVTEWISAAAGDGISFVTRKDGSLWAWGWNYYGQLGDGSATDKFRLVQVGSSKGWAQAAPRAERTVALQGVTAQAALNALPEVSYCAGTTVSISFSTSGNFQTGNSFSIQLSDAAGAFASPVTIGTGKTSPIVATIPAGTPTGLGYRIRLVSAVPAMTGADNGVNLSISAIPAAPSVSPSSRCGAGRVALKASGANTGQTYRWYTVPEGGSPIAGETASEYITLHLLTSATYYVSIANAIGCEGPRSEVTATITAGPTVLAGEDQQLCADAGALTLSGYSPTGGTWSGAGVSAAGLFDARAAGVGRHILTYSVTQGECTATATKTITVMEIPGVSFAPIGDVCSSNTGLVLNGGEPVGGSYSGPGVSDGVFNAAKAGVGTHEITYTYSQHGCTVTTTQQVTVATCTGIDESKVVSQVIVFPNPSRSSVRIEATLPSASAFTLRLFDVKGKLIYERVEKKSVQEVREALELKELAKGLYLLHLTTDKGTIMRRVVLE